MKILKFGGTSVGTPENIRQVGSIIQKSIQEDPDISVVVSAFTGVTNDLIHVSQLARQRDRKYLKILQRCEKRHTETVKVLMPSSAQPVLMQVQKIFHELQDILHGIYLLKELTPRSIDLIMGFGEQLSAYIISRYLILQGLPAIYTDARKLLITDDVHGHANILYQKSARKIRRFYDKNPGLKIITGFIATTSDGILTTLGRGGSDLTASFLGAVLKADEIQIWSDVDGVMSADPGKVPDAFCLKNLSYEEAMELSHFGAKVLHPPTIQPAMEKSIPIRILNTFNPDFEGTRVQKDPIPHEFPAKGITSIHHIALLTLQGSGMVGVTGISARAFSILAHHAISVILISQASSEHSICLAVKPEDALPAKKAIEKEFELEIKARFVDRVHVEKDLSVVALVGESMRKTPGIAGKLFRALAERSVNVVAIAQGSSELNISVVVSQVDEVRALQAIHEAFFSKTRRLNLLLCGTGLIGSEFLRQLDENHDKIQKSKNLDLHLIGLANRRYGVFRANGIPPADWQKILMQGHISPDPEFFLRQLKNFQGGQTVFIDLTASEEISQTYESYLKNGVSVVAANKIANTGDYEYYQTLQSLSRKKEIFFRYETNVGAGLPVIQTLKNLLETGDTILKIEAILSGTLSYLFNTFQSGEKTFSEIIREAQEKGFTEPDPRNDLNGLDFARKLLLLMRECGERVNLEDIWIDPLLPTACFEAATVEETYTILKNYDPQFEKARLRAAKNNRILRYIGVYENGKGRIELTEIDPDHPFARLKGSDNAIMFTTKRYHENPLVIQGPGAGAAVTAAGIMSELIIEN